ncbi:MAG TPA: type II toxin-antitoxin system prevent-host-death family antitoxin [Ilumatobacteraceae bacterium]|nr:type II toxin-antitoxin system prevent-host-death family antitoxin [Ilumatobacteraceae bacterium]HRB02555.1 type II toxin-antitoxin system prevent-host-death family antitoxin [Ilumatobacteraceae bacterium]
MSIEIGMRELRNSTGKVLDAIQTGEDIFLTNHGVRVAKLSPITHVGPDWSRHFDTLLTELPPLDTGFARFHDDDNDAAIEIEIEIEKAELA